METSELVPAAPCPRFVDAAVDIQVGERRRLLSYALPERLAGRVHVGQLVWVPLRRALKLAVVVRLHCHAPEFEVREVYAPVEPEFHLSPAQMELASWISEESLCGLFQAASLFLPPGVSRRSVEHLRLVDGVDADALPELTAAQRALVELLIERGETSLDAARRALGRGLSSIINALERARVVERVARVHNRARRLPTTKFVRLIVNAPVDLDGAPAQRRALQVIRRRQALSADRPLLRSELLSRGITATTLRTLEQRGLIETIELPHPAHAADDARYGNGAGGVHLTEEQAAAWREILRALRRAEPAEFLLHGVTGSGKTEIYLRAVAWCLSRGRQAILLVPEIALASQVVTRVTERFPGQVAIFHSALADSERYQTWSAIREGRIPIVVGPRSALFAPLTQVGLIVIDEEHEAAYKQDSSPRYHARDVARQLSQQHGATLILGSATPDVVTDFAARSGDIGLLELRERVGPTVIHEHGLPSRQTLALPGVEIVDMRLELQQGNTHIFSRALRAALERALETGEQAILFLNRRGSSTFIQCRACGHVERCPLCDVPLVFHADRGRLVCHRCNERKPPTTSCPECGSQAIGYYGTGTQRVEAEVRRLFPAARTLRWDQDALRRGMEHRHLMERVLRHEIDIVVGTQMVAKGLDFPLVSTIGVINADTMLHLPDFRSGERTFQLLTQVAGRAGRRAPGGRVIVQSYTPDHYAIEAASRHDYDAFYADETVFRRQHGYPPYRRLIRLLYRHSDEVTCQVAAEEVTDVLARTAYRLGLEEFDLLGPTPAFTAKIRGRYQWQILLRGCDAHAVVGALDLDPGWVIDVDPLSLL